MIEAFGRALAPGDPTGTSGRAILTAMTPIGRCGALEQVERVIELLSSLAAIYVNGAVWTVDGGQVA